jgi:hypothetical protein
MKERPLHEVYRSRFIMVACSSSETAESDSEVVSSMSGERGATSSSGENRSYVSSVLNPFFSASTRRTAYRWFWALR